MTELQPWRERNPRQTRILASIACLKSIGKWAWVLGVSAACGFQTLPADAQSAPLPAVISIVGTPIDPTTADTNYYGTNTNHTVGLCVLASSMCSSGSLPRAVAIQELARTLSQSGAVSYAQFAENVYEYVYKNIDTDFRYGLSKGAFGAILDQSGTTFDQVHLMGEVLKQGISAYGTNYGSYTVSYQAGTVTMSAAQFQAWTNITSAQAACQFGQWRDTV